MTRGQWWWVVAIVIELLFSNTARCTLMELDFIDCVVVNLEVKHDRCLAATLTGGRHVAVGLNYYDPESPEETLEGVLYNADTAMEIPGSTASLTGHDGVAEL